MTNVRTTQNEQHRRGESEPLVDRDELPDLPYTPREGWTSVIALAIMIISVAVAINDATWAGTVPGSPDSQTGFLPLAAFLSVLIGILLAKSRLGVASGYIIGSLLGAVFLLFTISATISRSPVLEERMRDLNLSVSTFINESYVLGIRSSETSVFLLVIGAVIWAAGLFGAYSVFRRHRPLPVVALTGLILLMNVAVTVREQYAHVVVFVAAALVLLMRLNLLDQTREWRMRGMRDVSDISSAFMRNGATFVALAIIAASVLATNASSAPLSRVFSDVDDELLDIGYAINRMLGGVSGDARGPRVLFTRTQTIRDFWQSSNEEVFTATTSDGKDHRWRGATYDSFDGRDWSQLDLHTALINPGDRLLAGTPEAVSPGRGWDEVVATVTPASFGGDAFVAPATPITIDRTAVLMTHGASGAFAVAELNDGLETGVPYTVRSLVRDVDGADALTASQLDAAGTDYPTWVRRYLDIRPGVVSEDVARLARSLANTISGQQTPYRIAATIQDYLWDNRRGGFTYETDMRGECAGERRLDCFMRIKKGFCEHFATAMVMMLRSVDVPARYVLGYLPGQEQADGSWRVNASAAHAWVEVFFPGFGWVEFDPTPGNQENGQQPTRLQPGGAVASPGDGDGGFVGQGELEGEGEFPVLTPGPDAAPPPAGEHSTSWGPLLVIVAVLVCLSILGIWAAWRRVPTAEPEVAYWGITRLAARLGHGPRPAQTAYEFAAGLGELMPVARDDLRLIATAKVEATYGNRRPGDSVLHSLALAYRRVRFGLLRLLIRRPRALGRPRGLRRRPR